MPLKEEGVEIEVIRRPKGNFDAAAILRAFRLCKGFGCDVFHCDNIHTSPLLGALLAGAKVRLWSKRSMSPAFEELRQPTAREKLAVSIRTSSAAATKILAVSGAVKKELVDMGISSAKIEVFWNPRPEFSISSEDRKRARERFGYGNSAVVFATTGHCVPVKGWDVLLHAFSEIVSDLPEAKLLIMGSTSGAHEQELFQELQSFIKAHGLEERILFAGHLGDVSQGLAAGDVFVQASRSEGFSFALVEGLAAGLPCISTSVGIALDVIQEGVHGFLVQRENVDALAARMLELGQNRELRLKLSENVKKGILAPTFEEYGEKLFSFCQGLLS